MATLSKKLDLVEGIWQEVVADGSFTGQINPSSTVEIVNADALPVGDVPEASLISVAAHEYFPAPVAGAMYVRVRSGTGYFKYWET